jgi:mono/diheme cytochrome c family protein
VKYVNRRERSLILVVTRRGRSVVCDPAWFSLREADMRYAPVLIALPFAFAITTITAAADKVDFNRDIRQLLSNNCFRCHGPDEKERKGGSDGLRLDTAAGATTDLGGHAAIVPGKPEASELIKRITSTDPDLVMPPGQGAKKLTPREVELLTQWIREGAKYSKHWSYEKPTRPEVPVVKNTAWPKNDVDRFLLARLEREGLQPQPEADRYTLIRRAMLDLTGLPPTVEEVDAFVNDKSGDAYERLIDRILQKETYGEHWARMWLDLARYADSAGYADDPPRKIWAYRDYVIRSFNANKPFDQFTVEQLAGDLLPSPTPEQLIATAFHRNTLTNNEGGTNDEEYRNVAIVDRVNTTLAVWMGTSMACAQCHTHKYDPITQQEYFRVFAILNNTEDADRGDESPLYSYYSPEQEEQRQQLQSQIAALEKKLSTPTPELLAGLAKWEAEFPKDLAWKAPKPQRVVTRSGMPAEVRDDASVFLPKSGDTDVYTVELPASGERLSSVRLEALPDDALQAKGPGHAGNFVVSRVTATITPPTNKSLAGRYVRIERPGKQVYLMLAEVQVFSGGENIATKGEASQINTGFEGVAKRAIDGNTNGKYFEANSVSHTFNADDPWWEVDLKSEQPIERIVAWQRVDDVATGKLTGFRVKVLDEKRQLVWEETIKDSPTPSYELSVNGQRSLTFAAAYADNVQTGFEPQNLLDNKDVKTKGWAVAPNTGKPSTLTLVAKEPIAVPENATITIGIEQLSQFPNHTLGHFRVSLSDDARAREVVATPANIVAILRTATESRTKDQAQTLLEYFAGTISPELKATRDELVAKRKELEIVKPVTVPIMKELAGGARRKTKLQYRGNFLDLGPEVTEGVPAAFHPLTGDKIDRLALARWLVDENNPLTARVIANRFWENVFGMGLVRTSEEFGTQGELPSHPELLDYLATELVAKQWNVKEFLRMLVTSAAYRQSSKVSPELFDRDPDNRLLARGPRFRLSAEMIRDQALAASGLLSTKMYGPSVKPPRPSLGLSAAFGGGLDWQTSAGEDKFRRGLYTEWRRTSPYPSMATFDAPNREVCTLRRNRTNTPLQALVTLNDPVYIEASQALARKMAAASGSPIEKLTLGFRQCVARPPTDAETKRLLALYEEAKADYAKDPNAAKTMATVPLGDAGPSADYADLAAWTVVANVVMNLDEFLMKR